MSEDQIKAEIAQLEAQLTPLMVVELLKWGDATPRGKRAKELVNRLLELEGKIRLR